MIPLDLFQKIVLLLKSRTCEFEIGSQPVKPTFVFSSFALTTNFSTVKLLVIYARVTHVAGKKKL